MHQHPGAASSAPDLIAHERVVVGGLERISDLPGLLDQNPHIREDFIAMLASFFERHHIEVSPEDLGEADDVVAYVFGPPASGKSAGPPDQRSPAAQ